MAYISHCLYFAFVWGRGKETELTHRYSVLKADTLDSGHNCNWPCKICFFLNIGLTIAELF